jgi:hypothetical protein
MSHHQLKPLKKRKTAADLVRRVERIDARKSVANLERAVRILEDEQKQKEGSDEA